MEKWTRAGFSTVAISSFAAILLHLKSKEDIITAIVCLFAFAICLFPVFRSHYRAYDPINIVLLLFSHGMMAQMAWMFSVREVQLYQITLSLDEHRGVFHFGLLCYIISYLAFWSILENQNIKFNPINKLNYFFEKYNTDRLFSLLVGTSVVAITSFFVFTLSLEEFSWTDKTLFSGKRFLENYRENPWDYEGHLFHPLYPLYKLTILCSAVGLFVGTVFWGEIKGKTGSLWLLVLLFCTNALCSTIIGDRSGILTTVLTLVLIIHLQNEQKQYNKYYFAALSLVVVIGFFTTFTRSGFDASYWQNVQKTFFHVDFLDIKRSSYILHSIPEKVGYLYGESLVGWAAVGIPHETWPNKPIFLQEGHIISQLVFENKNRTGVYPGLIAESYWNFWLLGPIIFCGLIGVISNIFKNWLEKYPKSPMVTMLYSVFLTHGLFFCFSHSFGMGILKFLAIALPILALLFLSSKNIRFNGTISER